MDHQQEQDGAIETTGATENGGPENGEPKSKHGTKQRNGRPVSGLIFDSWHTLIFRTYSHRSSLLRNGCVSTLVLVVGTVQK
jgi:hypothetical protein